MATNGSWVLEHWNYECLKGNVYSDLRESCPEEFVSYRVFFSGTGANEGFLEKRLMKED